MSSSADLLLPFAVNLRRSHTSLTTAAGVLVGCNLVLTYYISKRGKAGAMYVDSETYSKVGGAVWNFNA